MCNVVLDGKTWSSVYQTFVKCRDLLEAVFVLTYFCTHRYDSLFPSKWRTAVLLGFFPFLFLVWCPLPLHCSYCLDKMVIPSLDTAAGRIVAQNLCYLIKKQERAALYLFAHQQLNKCGSKGTIFAWYRVFFSSSGARKLTKLIFNSQPSSRVCKGCFE